MKSKKLNFNLNMLQSILLGSSLLLMTSPAFAVKTTDGHGNVGYDTAAECDAAVANGTAKFYRPFTSHPPLKRNGEASVQSLTLKDVTAENYSRGACDIGVGRSNDRDGVSSRLIGKYVPYSPAMPVNVYFDDQNKVVRATMKQCDNNFGGNLPRPVPAAAVTASSECFVTIVNAEVYEPRTQTVVKAPAYKRYEVVPATYKMIEEKVLVSPEYTRQIPVPATYKTIEEEVEVKPATTREEIVPATYKVVTDQVMVRPESKRFEIIPETYKTVTEQVIATPASKTIKVIPAVYEDKMETVAERPATMRVETIPATFKTVTEEVVVRPEYTSYEPISLPMRAVTEQVLFTDAGARIEATDGAYRTVSERVLVKEATTRLVEVPAVYTTVTEQVKVADSSTEWKRGKAWLSKALETRSAKDFKVGADGRVNGSRVDAEILADKYMAEAQTGVSSSSASTTPATSTASATSSAKVRKGAKSTGGDDLICLVQIPERFETITRQVLKTPATVRTEIVPAVYSTVTHKVLDRQPATRKIDVPATYQTVTSQVIDIEKLREQGYKFDNAGNITATPSGDRVIRASQVPNASVDSSAKKGTDSAASGAISGTEAYVREIIIPAEKRMETRQVVDTPATTRTVVVPSAVQTIKRRVLVSEAKSTEVEIPATYQTITRQVVDKPASTREVVIPAEYKTVERRVVDVPASTNSIPVPAVTKLVKRRVIDAAATTRDKVIPAVYKMQARQVIDQAETTREIEVPAVYETITTKVKVADASTERRAIMCEANATPAKISEIQRALKAAGYNPGSINGRINARTIKAINRYQVDKQLPVDAGGKYLNIDTVNSLGVSF